MYSAALATRRGQRALWNTIKAVPGEIRAVSEEVQKRQSPGIAGLCKMARLARFERATAWFVARPANLSH